MAAARRIQHLKVRSGEPDGCQQREEGCQRGRDRAPRDGASGHGRCRHQNIIVAGRSSERERSLGREIVERSGAALTLQKHEHFQQGTVAGDRAGTRHRPPAIIFRRRIRPFPRCPRLPAAPTRSSSCSSRTAALFRNPGRPRRCPLPQPPPSVPRVECFWETNNSYASSRTARRKHFQASTTPLAGQIRPTHPTPLLLLPGAKRTALETRLGPFRLTATNETRPAS